MDHRTDSSHGARLGFLDELRGIAASVVVIAHIGPVVSDNISWLYTHVVDLGQLGVVLFFLCSGFVIPASMDREGSLTAFWIKRFFRLYPLFWLSLVGALLLALAAIKENGDLALRDWVANVSMVPAALGADLALPPYWTLGYEMAFYLLATALVAMRINHMSVEAALLTGGAGIFLALLVPVPAGDQLNGGVFWVGTMLTGAVIHRWYVGEARTRSAVACVVGTLLVGLATAFTGLYGVPRDEDPYHSHFWPIVIAWGGAYALFLAFLTLRKRSVPWLIGLGTISYSMYLMHELVLAVIPEWGLPGLSIAVGFSLTVAVSAITYRWVEAPAIGLGTRSSDRYKAWRRTRVTV
jgi:peptidoglycan/LPS O-acetylase OafA/YrhL